MLKDHLQFLGEMTDKKAGQEKDKISLGYFITLECKKYAENDWDISKATGAPIAKSRTDYFKRQNT